MGRPLVLPEHRLFVYGWPMKCNEQGQSMVIFGFKVGNATVITEDGRVLIGPIQQISHN